MTRNLVLDSLKILLACMVVGIHGGFLTNHPAAYFLTVNGLFRIAVPIFFIINGYYFSKVKDRESFVTWVTKSLLLYTFWSIIFSFFWINSESLDAGKIIEFIIVGYGHLWYLPAMIGAGILTFLLKGNTKIGIASAIICYLCGVIIQYTGNYHLSTSAELDKLTNIVYLHRNFLFFAFPFFYIGQLLNTSQLIKSIDRTYIILAFIFGGLFLIGESWNSYTNPLHDDPWFDNYLSLIIICPTIFIIANRCRFQYGNRYLAQMSASIYLIHPLWLIYLNSIAVPAGTLMTLGCISLSLVSSYILIKLHKYFKFIL